MQRILYFIGAGLTRALALPTYPVPTMLDFISTCAEYITDDVVRTTLVVVENSLPYPYAWESDSARSLARRLVGPDTTSDPGVWSEFARALRDRPGESIEDLLDRTGDTTSNRYSHDVEERFRYAIRRLFTVIGWNIEWRPLASFLTQQFDGVASAHTFISFNYDLVLERGIQRVLGDRFDPSRVYGFPIKWQATGDPPSTGRSPGGVLVIPLNDSGVDSYLSVLKPHGSLNWLTPIAGCFNESANDDLRRGRTVIIALGEDGVLHYHPYPRQPSGDLWGCEWVQLPSELSGEVIGATMAVEPVIVTPRGAKKPHRQYLRDVWEQEEAAILTADEVYVLGWSIPRGDQEQECLIRYAVGRRSQPFQRVTVVNLSAGVDYYDRVRDIFGVERKAVRTFNTGFCQFAATK